MSNVTKSFTFEGKRYYVRGKTEREAIENIVKKKQELEKRSTIASKDITVAEWAIICYDTYKRGGVKEETYKKYVNRLKACVCNQPIGRMQVQKVKNIDCQNCINAQAGNSEYQIKQTRYMLNFIFKKAVKADLILRNPADDLELIKGTVTKRRNLTDYEEQVFLKAAENDKFMVFKLMYYCGCRPAEAPIVQGLDIVHAEVPLLHIRGTKNEKADRYVPIPKEFYEKIKNTPQFGFVAPTEAGTKMSRKAFERRWRALSREMNILMGCRVYRNALVPPFPLAEDIVPYCLRHTFCTNLLKENIDPRITQYVMGHTNSETTDIYTHIDKQLVIDAFSKKCNTSATVVQHLY